MKLEALDSLRSQFENNWTKLATVIINRLISGTATAIWYHEEQWAGILLY